MPLDCSRLLSLESIEKRFGDLDDIFAYETARTVLIRDRRLGLTFLLTEVCILAYVVVWQTVLNQQYRVDSAVFGVARICLKRPDKPYRWDNGNGPYCIGGRGDPTSRLYSFSNGTYEYASVGVTSSQFPCQYLDQRYAEQVMGNNEAFLVTRTTVIVEEATLDNVDGMPMPAAPGQAHPCAGLAHTACTFREKSRVDYYTADAEMFLVSVEHSMSAPDAGLRRTVRDMAGSMVGPDKMRVDPCAVYGQYAAGCPSNVNVGSANMVDAFPVKSLLSAAGIPSLDARAGPVGSALGGTTLRASGVSVLLVIHYTNLFLETGSMEEGVVQYAYRVDVIPNAEFKMEQTVGKGDLSTYGADGSAYSSSRTSIVYDDTFPRPIRTVYIRHGVNIVVTQSGHVGSFDLQMLLLNLTVSLGLLSAAAWIADTIALKACPLRHIYQQYKEKKTLDFSDVKAAELYLNDPKFLSRFVEEDNLIEPLPPIFQELLDAKSKWESEHGGPLSIREAGLAGIRLDLNGARVGSLEKAEANMDAQAGRMKSRTGQVRFRVARHAGALVRQATVGLDTIRAKLGGSPHAEVTVDALSPPRMQMPPLSGLGDTVPLSRHFELQRDDLELDEVDEEGPNAALPNPVDFAVDEAVDPPSPPLFTSFPVMASESRPLASVKASTADDWDDDALANIVTIGTATPALNVPNEAIAGSDKREILKTRTLK